MALLTGYPWLEESGKKGGFYFLLGRHWKSCPFSRPNSSPPSSLQLSLSPLDFLYLYTPSPIGPVPTAPISNSFIEIQFIYHTVHPLKVCDSVGFSIFSDMCNHHHSQFYICHHREKPCTLSHPPTPKGSLFYLHRFVYSRHFI